MIVNVACLNSSEEVQLKTPIRYLPRIIWTIIGAFIATLIIAPLIIVISLFTSGAAAKRLSQTWASIVSWFLGATSSISGLEKIEPNTSYIVTPNHQSHSDIVALLINLPLKFRWVIKKELLKVPLFGPALAGTGAISLDRSNQKESIKTLQNAKNKLQGGWSILIYPEGTRSPDGAVHDFKKGAFMLAVQTGAPILPVTCNGAYKILPKKTLAIRPGHISVIVGDPIPVTGLTEKDVPELMERTRAVILSNFDKDYDPFRD